MAAISTPQSARGLAKGTEARTWGHEKNKKSEERHQNFSYPSSYSRPQSPATAEEFRTPTSGTFPTDSSPFYKNSDSYPSSSSKPLSDLPVNTIDSARIQSQSENSRNGDGLTTHSRQRSKAYPPLGAMGNRKISHESSLSKGSDPSKWIHREKLTQIEINEYLALGKEPPPELLEQFRESERRVRGDTRYVERTPAAYENGPSEPWPEVDEGITEVRPSYKETILAQRQQMHNEEEEDAVSDDGEPFVPVDPRTPEEIAADPYEEGSHQVYNHTTGLRSSSSRIPLSKTSPVPVPQQHLDRNQPLPRKRGASNNWDEDAILYPGARSRSHSVGSQVLLDDGADLDSGPSSPSRNQTQSQPRQASKQAVGNNNSRKPSTNRNASAGRPRNASTGQRGSPSLARPTTRDGNRAPAGPTHRPEGDPPWLASMYKPDPRLPPDQQVIPTHAKRMMQEQWEKEGKSGSAFDRQFQPVSVYPDLPAEQEVPSQGEQRKDADGGPASNKNRSPLQEKQPRGESGAIPQQLAAQLQASPTKSPNPNQDHAGWSTIPKVQGTPRLSRTASPRPEQQAQFQMQTPDDEEGKPKKGGCGCCVVM